MRFEVSAKNKKGNFFKAIGALILIVASCPFARPLPNIAEAASDSIVINEVFYDPEGSDSGNEWLEIKNVGEEPVELDSWTIQVAGSAFSDRATLPEHLVDPGEIILIGEENVAGADITVPTLSMQNGGSATDGVRVLDGSRNTIDTLLYDEPNENELLDDTGEIGTDFAPDVSSGHSLARITDIDSDNSFEDFAEVENPSPGEENVFAPVAEFTFEEPVYIFTDVSLDGADSHDPDGEIQSWSWEITDPDGDLVEYSGEQIIHVFEKEGDHEVRLLVTDNEGLSSEKTSTISAEEDPENPIITDISDAKKLDVGKKVTIQGKLTAPVPCLYENETYVQDETGGIRIKLPEELDVDFNDVYQISGKISTTYGEKRITVENAKKIDREIDVKPAQLKTSDVDENKIGLLITTEALVKKSQGDYLYLEIPGTEDTLRVKFSKYADVEKPEDAKGKYLLVTGIVSRFGTEDDGSAKIRVMPRFEADVSLNEQPQMLALTGSPIFLIQVSAAGLFLSASALLILRRRDNLDMKDTFC